MRRRDMLRGLGLGAVSTALAACGPAPRLPSPPENLRVHAPFAGLPDDTRFFLDGRDNDVFDRIVTSSFRREMDFVKAGGRRQLGDASFLALSGGGENGAYGAGLLTAWSQTGTRPEFKVVTGISTGALSAPAAFLGPAYDQSLESFYTETTQDSIMTSRGMLAALSEDSLFDSTPLLHRIQAFLTPQVIAAIAREYLEKGRLLFVATTDLDLAVSVMWNLGGIAASGHLRSAELLARVLLASSSIPAILPPVMIDIEAGGRRYQEMHVDGAAMAEIVLYPPKLSGADSAKVMAGFDRREIEAQLKRPWRFYGVRNARPGPDGRTIERSTFKIAQRAVAVLTASQGIGDLYQLYLLSQRDRADYNLAYIPRSFTERLDTPFDPAYMRKLYAVGRAEMLAGRAWHKTPPGYDPRGLDQFELPAAPPAR